MQYPKFKVTVQCATFQHAKYITDAMNGFTMQQTDFPFVCTIIDDASTDGEQAVISNYLDTHFDLSEDGVAYKKETDYAHIIYARHKTNKNCYFAVLFLKENHYSQKKDKKPYLKEWMDNVDYIALCEGDDYWIDPLKLQKQVEILDKNTDISLCGSNGIILAENFCQRAKYFNNIIKSRVLTNEEVINHWTMPTASLIYRKVIIKKYPQWTQNVVNGDQLLHLMSLLHGKIYCMNAITCVYRKIDGGSIIANLITNQLIKGQSNYLYLYENYYKDYKNEENNEILKKKIKSIKKQLKYEMSFKTGTWIFNNKAYLFYIKKFIRCIFASFLYRKAFLQILDKKNV